MPSGESHGENERPRAREDVLCRTVDDGVILYEPEEGKVHTLNPVAAYIWDCLDGRHTLAEIAEGLRSAPDSGGRDLLADVREAVEKFRREGLLQAPAGQPS